MRAVTACVWCWRSACTISLRVWTEHINEIEKIQRRAARFVTGVFTLREASVSGMLKNLGWQTLQTRRCIARLAMLHKTTNHLTATTLPTYVLPSQRTSLRGKHPCSLTPIRANTDRYLYSYFPRTIRCWNILPVELIQLETSQEFKSTLSAGISAGDYMITNPRSVFNRPRLGSCPNSGQALYLFKNSEHFVHKVNFHVSLSLLNWNSFITATITSLQCLTALGTGPTYRDVYAKLALPRSKTIEVEETFSICLMFGPSKHETFFDMSTGTIVSGPRSDTRFDFISP